jgi:hypothetical protein
MAENIVLNCLITCTCIFLLVGFYVGSRYRNCRICEEKDVRIGQLEQVAVNLKKEIEKLKFTANENEVKIGVYERVHR